MKKLISIRISYKNDFRLKEMAAADQCSQAEIIARALTLLFERRSGKK